MMDEYLIFSIEEGHLFGRDSDDKMQAMVPANYS